jgi:membrane-associated protease RseP (regulator of RpoE activity)
MTMMTMRRVGAGALLLGLAAFEAAPGAAQDTRLREGREVREECRCVDRDGNEIENCSCLRIPEIDLGASGLIFSGRRARIGVWVEGETGSAASGAALSEVLEDGPAWEGGLRAGDVVTHVDGQSVLQPLADAEAEAELDEDGPVAVQRFVYLVGNLEAGEEAEFTVLRNGERRTFSVTPETAGATTVGFRSGGPVVFWNDEEGLRVELQEQLEALREGEFFSREQQEELRRELENVRGRLRVLRERPDAPTPPAFGYRGLDGRTGGVWRLDTPGEGRNGFVVLGGDPCFADPAESGAGGAVSILRGSENCVDGVEFVELNPELAEYFDAPADGVLVTEVAEAATLGLRAGDVLLAIGGREVRGATHARRILSSYELDEEVRLRVVRQGREMEVLGRRREP